MRNSERCYDC